MPKTPAAPRYRAKLDLSGTKEWLRNGQTIVISDGEKKQVVKLQGVRRYPPKRRK